MAEFLDSPRVVILGITEKMAQFYAEILDDELRRAGTPIPTNDIWIASAAQEHGLRLFSRDQHLAAVAGLLLVAE